ncbi:hypothetical protein C0J50_4303 [Silurus asotus]|uniref:Cystatin fetuin-A-type domain-containing protein n=1 Tax=Silurus asotus TaxID=30991 RepID=A0AAD5AAB3_SILAS|nr:hypothetical protein C0J50_4303 [Silurus asotus]
MNLKVLIGILGLVAYASCSPLKLNVTQLLCNSPEAAAAAQVSLDFINAQHTHGYKYTLNQIEDFEVVTKPDGTQVYLLELEFLETKCHVYHPKPVSECEVRPKSEMAVEADCDVVLSEAGGNFSVVAFKCKTEIETIDLCTGCIILDALNDTDGNQLVRNTLENLNKNHTLPAIFALHYIGRLTHQVISGGFRRTAEYAIIETNCTSVDDGSCVPLDLAVARHGFCHAEDNVNNVQAACDVFEVGSAPPAGPVSPSTKQGLKHHELTALHDPSATGYLSSESHSAEKAPVVKRTAGDPQPALVAKPEILLPRCPGPVIHF